MGKKPNFWNDFIRPIGKYIVRPGEKMASRLGHTLAPVAKPILGAATNKAVEAINSVPPEAIAGAVSMKKGGMVKPKGGRKTQIIKAHAGELVVPKAFVPVVSKSLKQSIKKKGGRNM